MPTVFYFKGYRFYFFSRENDEPVHVHVEKAEASAKFWLLPEVREEYSYGFTGKQRKEIKKIILDNLDTLKTAWYEHFK
jgi:hypothetical protein